MEFLIVILFIGFMYLLFVHVGAGMNYGGLRGDAVKDPPMEGDVVRIRSGGGPTMTVGCRIGDARWVHWWDEDKKKFMVDMLYPGELEVIQKR